MDLEIILTPGSGVPLYEQIYTDIRDRIRRGELISGERLPSTRVLAQKLHVARTTTGLAYEQLEAEGYIEIRPGSGAYICDIENIPDISIGPAQGDTGSSAAAGDPAAGGRRASPSGTGANGALPAAGRGTALPKAGAVPEIDFSPRTIDMSGFPYATWRRIMRGILTGDRPELFARGDPQGDIGLRTTIARYLQLSRGCRCTPDQIVIGAGNDYLMLLLAMVLGEGQRVGMESPTYLRAADILRAMRSVIVPVRSDTAGMDVRALRETDCSLVYVMPTRQYPTGTVMPYPRRAQLLQWAAEAPDRYIIEDDYDSEFRYRGRPVPSLQSQDSVDRVIYVGTFSKAIAPAIRVSYMILPRCLMETFHTRAQVMSCTVPRMDQSILDEFIRDGYFERHLNRMRSRYRVRHDLLLEELSPLTGRFDIRGIGAGLHLLLELREGQPDASSGGAAGDTEGETIRARNLRVERCLEEQASAAGVRVYPMSDLYLDAELPEGQRTPPSIMLGYAALTEEEIRRGAAVLSGIWRT